MFQILIKNGAYKELQKIKKSNAEIGNKLFNFISTILATTENPCTLPNAKHLQGYSDNRYRWRIGDYRIIAIVENGETKIIEIIKVAKRNESTYKGL